MLLSILFSCSSDQRFSLHLTEINFGCSLIVKTHREIRTGLKIACRFLNFEIVYIYIETAFLFLFVLNMKRKRNYDNLMLLVM